MNKAQIELEVHITAAIEYVCEEYDVSLSDILGILKVLDHFYWEQYCGQQQDDEDADDDENTDKDGNYDEPWY